MVPFGLVVGMITVNSVMVLASPGLHPWRHYYHEQNNHNATGDYVYHSKNTYHAYQCIYTEDSKYCQLLTFPTTRDSYDITAWGDNIELCVDSGVCGADASCVKYCLGVYGGVKDVEYSMMLSGSEDCFGCCNLKKGKYCILNKQYSKEDYYALRSTIIKDMNERPYKDARGRTWKYGDFFPYDLSPFGYNESCAHDYFPLSESNAEAHSYPWSRVEESSHKITWLSENIPDSIEEVDDSVVKEILECSSCKKAYRIVIDELSLLRKLGVPVPRKCPHCRHRDRILRLTHPQFSKRTCQCTGETDASGSYKNTTQHSHGSVSCTNEFETPYTEDSDEIVYCEECYQREIM